KMSKPDHEFTIQNYLEAIQNKKLMGSKCKDCGNQYVPPRKLCTECNSTNLEWVEMSGNGKVAAYSCIGVGTTFMVNKGYSMKKPYCFSVIELEEGPMISGQLVGVDETKPETIKVGMPVKVKFLDTDLKGETRVDLGFEPK
ncbi:MAG: Zn-ribbon domain-containing OB-fold protein, partial [Candidatus Lokiarchaeota archaeon]